MVKIHWIDAPVDTGPVYWMFLEGIKANPRVTLVPTHEEADWVFYHHLAFRNGAAYDGPLDKLVVIDFMDTANIDKMPKGARAYFVRSWHSAKRNETGCFEKVDRNPPWPDNFFPLTMCARDAFWLDNPPKERDIDVTCPLRGGMHNRNWVLKELQSYFEGKPYVTRLGAIDKGTRRVPGNDYLETLARSKIVVTCQPDSWEGDWRTWEAFASGACVISDKIWLDNDAPEPDYWCLTPGHGVYHWGEYIPIGELCERLLIGKKLEDYCLGSWRCIGTKGQERASIFHRPSNRIDEILWRLEGLSA